MTNYKISDLPATQTAGNTDVVPVVQGGITYKMPLSLLVSLGAVPLDGSVTLTKLAAALVDPAATSAGARTLGTGAQQGAAGNDVRFTGYKNRSDRSAAFTVAASDVGSLVVVTASGAVSVTLPTPSSLNLSVGQIITLAQGGAGVVTAAAGTGVTLRYPGSLSTRAQYSRMDLTVWSTTEWLVDGDTA